MPTADTPTEPTYWRSLEDKKGGRRTAFMGREFPFGATDIDEPTRRDFLKLLGLSGGAASLAACQRNPSEKILPYTKQPADIRPGIPLHFASSLVRDGFGFGVLVTSNDGRPTSLQGNPDHSVSAGSSSTYEQAAVYNLYDPQRLKMWKSGGREVPREAFFSAVKEHATTWAADGGKKLRFLVEPTTSPSELDLRKTILAKFPQAKFYAWAPISRDAVYESTTHVFGTPLEPQYDFDKARVIVSLDADFLMESPASVHYARDFAAHRVPENELNRLYIAEARHSITGANADHRIGMRASEVAAFGAAILAGSGGEWASFQSAIGRFAGDKRVAAIIKDLKSAGKSALVVPGLRQPTLVHVIAALLNASLGSECVTYTAPATPDTVTGPASLSQLAEEIRMGAVETLVISAYNPVYTAPADLKFAELLAKVPNVVYHARFEDETAPSAKWLVPATHEFEAWGDVAAIDGTISFIQPMISPLFNGINVGELLSPFAGLRQSSYEITKAYWKKRSGKAADFALFWDGAVQKGIYDGEKVATVIAKVQTGGKYLSGGWQADAAKKTDGFELNFVVDSRVYDGRYADNAWLQELPDPMTKVTWGNNLIIGPTTAQKLGVETEDRVEIEIGGASIAIAVFVLPGQAEDTGSIQLGFGRDGSEIIAAKASGANAYKLRTSAGQWFVGGVQVKPLGIKEKLAITQEHWDMENRPVALDIDAEELKHYSDKHAEGGEGEGGKKKLSLPILLSQQGENETLYTNGVGEQHEPQTDLKYQWGMSIDMSKCTGCNACIIACESENNILVVGKDQVRRGREMQWLRIDRYFKGSDTDNPEVVMQPVACVHCENAPCEYVCPVNATMHDEEGLNVMVYNRCVGTRYCSNNCPYKARRFNFLNYHNDLQGSEEMAMNPDVTVRSRGVMEKCTYCIQRIEKARIISRIEKREIVDGEVSTACEQSCPSRAIVFGSLHRKESRVSKTHEDKRAYQLLKELNTRPRTLHLAKVRNPNPELV